MSQKITKITFGNDRSLIPLEDKEYMEFEVAAEDSQYIYNVGPVLLTRKDKVLKFSNNLDFIINKEEEGTVIEYYEEPEIKD